MKGIDTASNTHAHAAKLAASGCQFVFRYYGASNNPSKHLSRQEAEEISANGMQVGVVWENDANHDSYFSAAKGATDGHAAFRYASGVIGQPRGSAIYFAVDYDALEAVRKGAITQYFKAIVEAFKAESGDQEGYQIGVYGSGATCQEMLDAGLVTKTWLAQSTGFQGYHSFTSWSVKQGAQELQAGIAVDPDESVDDFGGFVLASTPAVLVGADPSPAAPAAPAAEQPPPWNPPIPPGTHYPKQSAVTPAMVAFAKQFVATAKMHEVSTPRVIDGQNLVARIAWHTYQAATGRTGLFKGCEILFVNS